MIHPLYLNINVPLNTLIYTYPMVSRLRHGIKKPVKHLNLHIDSESPLHHTYSQAFEDPNWIKEMQEECVNLMENKTWTLVPCHIVVNIINHTWIVKKKLNVDGNLSCYKARLVAN